MLRVIALASGLSLACAFHMPNTPAAHENTGPINVDSGPRGSIASSVYFRDAAFVSQSSGRSKHAETEASEAGRLVRSEKKKVVPSSGEADTVRLLQQRRQAQEEEFAIEFGSMIDGELINMANMNAQQSSTKALEDGTEEGPAGKAIDGNAATGSGVSCTKTKYDYKPWWEVDLGSAYHLSKVQFTVRKDECGEQREICPPLKVMVDRTACHGIDGSPNDWADITPAPGDTKDVNCPMVGQAIRISTSAHDELILCEVKVWASPQSLLETAVAQCESHSVLAQQIKTSSKTTGRCIGGQPSLGNEAGFRQLFVGQANGHSGGELQATFEECEELLLKSDDLVEGAEWQESPASSTAESTRGLGKCRLLMGQKVVGAEPAVGARCFRKLHCPSDVTEMAKWKKRAGIGLKNGQSWR